MSTSQHQTASGRPLRVAPAWVGAAGPTRTTESLMPVREAVWIWSVRRYARVSLWALPVGAALYGWSTLGVGTPPGLLVVEVAAGWLCTLTAPSCALMMPCTTDNPSPVPCPVGLVVKKGSKMRSRVASFMPAPLSFTVIRTYRA